MRPRGPTSKRRVVSNRHDESARCRVRRSRDKGWWWLLSVVSKDGGKSVELTLTEWGKGRAMEGGGRKEE